MSFLGIGGSHPDSTPLYLQAMLQAQALANQQTQQALENKRADEQFEWSKQAYADAQAQAVPINAQQLKNMQQQYDIAKQAQDRYTQTFIPLEDQYIASAKGWDTPEAEAAAAGAAEANVAQQLQEGRSAATRALQAYGIDPGSPKYANLEIGSRTGGAAATAGAGNQAISQRQQEGLQLLQNASTMGRNLQPTALQGYAGSNASGTGVIGNTNMINTTGASTMGTGLQWGQMGLGYGQLGNQSIGNIGSTFNNLYQGQVAQADAETQGLYGLAGAVVGGASNLMRPKIPGLPGYAEGGAIPENASPTQGIAVDDVPARLSPGEFVVPKDVVQWKGEEHFQKLIDQSREKRQEATAKPDIKPAQAIPVSGWQGAGDYGIGSTPSIRNIRAYDSTPETQSPITPPMPGGLSMPPGYRDPRSPSELETDRILSSGRVWPWR